MRNGTKTKQTSTWFKRMTAALYVSTCALPLSAAELLKLPTRPGVTQGIYLVAASSRPSWVALLFAGDDGNVSLSDVGPTRLRGNFLMRTASYWLDHDAAYAIFDAPSDNAGGMRDAFRLSADAIADIRVAVSELRKRYPDAKVVLIGTSRGTITVGNVLKRNPGLADAFVLTSPVTQSSPGHAGLSGLTWKGNEARVLILSNENDGCLVSTPVAARRVAEENGFDFVAVFSAMGGGDRRSDCQAQSPHGFLGIETEVLADISGWLSNKP